ncbi:MAG TPA: phospholipase A [Lacunisphaera sp.]|nr:phospholipase A [Lacunisphaera sp.]
MKTTPLILLFALVLGSARAGGVSLNLLAPAGPQTAGSEISVDLLWLNTGAEPRSVRPPAELDAILRQPQSARPVRLREAKTSSRIVTLERGGFARRTYTVRLPAGSRGPSVLAIDAPFAAEALLDIAPSFDAALAPPAETSGPAAPGLRPVAGRLHRTVLENFGFHEPIYFLYGADEPGAKFQLSFRYRLAGQSSSPVASEPAGRGLYVAYTQRSLWNIKEPSSPFYDTSYMPELMFESLAPESPDRDRLVNFLGYQAGYRHESNGKDGDDSRSLDIAYLRSGLLIGHPDGWRALVVPRVFAYLSTSTANDDIDDYRGFGELLVGFGRNDGIQINVTGMIGRDWDKGSVQVDVTQPIKIPAVHFDTFLHLQFFDGYGECLRDYNRRSSTWRAGISLVR